MKKGKGLKITCRQLENEMLEYARSAVKEAGIGEDFAENLFRNMIKYIGRDDLL